MADNQDKLTPSDEKKLEELEKQIAKDKAQKPVAKPKQTAESEDKGIKKQPVKPSATAANKSSNKSTGFTSSNKPAPDPNTKTGLLWFFTIINCLVLGALIAAGYWAWLQWQTQNQKHAEAIAAQQINIDRQKNNVDLSIASNQLTKNNLEAQNQALQTSLQNLNAQVQANQQNLADVSGRRPADWLLAEADYLVRMAGRKLWLEHDVKTAIMMLQSADSRIEDLGDPSLLPIRSSVADDIQALQQVNQVSISSIALSLGAMFKQVDTLPLAFYKKPPAPEKDEGVTGSIDDWRSNLARNWQNFTKNFFSVSRVTTEIQPFMSQQQQWLSKQQLKFALQQAQASVLQENATLYQQSLQSALALLIEYFDTNNDRVIQFTASLGNLQQTNFERAYPQQLNAAPLLQDVIEQRLDARFVNGNH
ncbi:uroporphyrinogen-III C-methyltransferase [uncultured Paraglaciecola sp.]|uniref:uroporphyrinogen-III C-methyltransferase n=1 Tax=uncultured Paraglaciecola sp. TaxID=1765024 RepID=UPI00262535C8|nr:uroporphyrinogen-III C-methyltransferase [uncultured Paraglaciecola sp.]